MLETRNLRSGYGRIPILDGLSFSVKKGEVVGILGHNGMGKTTLLKTLIGEIRVTGGEIFLNDKNITESEMFLRSRAGMAYVPQGREIFPNLTVLENLRMGEITRPNDSAIVEVLEYFPILKELRHLPSTALSGGQQQMLAIGRALMSNPEIILFDELSLGLAPIIIKNIYNVLPTIIKDGMSAIIIEQDITKAIQNSNHLYCLQEGKISLDSNSNSISQEEITKAYFGL